MTWFGQSKMVITRNQPSLFDPQNSRDNAGTNRDNRDILTGGEGHQPGHSGTPPLKGGVHCPDVSGVELSRSRPDPAEAFKTRNDIKTAFDAWTAEGQPWPPPAGLTSAIASRLIPRASRTPHKWR